MQGACRRIDDGHSGTVGDGNVLCDPIAVEFRVSGPLNSSTFVHVFCIQRSTIMGITDV